ncbi:hypothetical protein EV642_11787 [Kribbella sp. VKM Ac-2500]|nr:MULTISPECIES: hypothetical protein [Kribbella]TCN35294.1 hypothetical protein EV642_11787 [Kribbella sp. VKM Ac-2500]
MVGIRIRADRGVVAVRACQSLAGADPRMLLFGATLLAYYLRIDAPGC